MQQPALLRCREHRDRVRRAGRAEVRALQRIDGDVDRRQLRRRPSPSPRGRPSRRCRASAPRRAPLRRSRSCRRSARCPGSRASPRRRPGRTCGHRPGPSCARTRSPPVRRRARNSSERSEFMRSAVHASSTLSAASSSCSGGNSQRVGLSWRIAEHVVRLHDLVNLARALVDHRALCSCGRSGRPDTRRSSRWRRGPGRSRRPRAPTRPSRTTWPGRSRACCGGRRSSGTRAQPQQPRRLIVGLHLRDHLLDQLVLGRSRRRTSCARCAYFTLASRHARIRPVAPAATV